MPLDQANRTGEGHVLAVVGGGDTSPEEALYLTKYARHVPPCPDHAIEAREDDRDDDEDEDLCIHDD
ncbi:hypothetical protein Taro_044965 [Colocasia esculenta]|uniref:Uncharacterized protein n=1 Tax=Colocasia esculenta TaxID=4460 RepID=A0A843WVW4_COLES|nr:hypothetical protein [Colocasia esculenta]